MLAIGKSFSDDEIASVRAACAGASFDSTAAVLSVWALIAETPESWLNIVVFADELSAKVRALSEVGRIALVELIEQRGL